MPKRKRSDSSNFRFNAITLYATFPKCPTPKEKIVDNIKLMFGEKVEYYIVCNELHEDGELHSHVLIKFKAKIDRSDSKFADPLSKNENGKTWHGNYQSARNVHQVIDYIKKAGNYLDSGNLPEKKTKISTTFACAVMEGKTLRELNVLDPGYMLMNYKKIREYQQAYSDILEEEQNASMKRLVLPLAVATQDQSLLTLVDWCNANFYNRERAIRSPQLWVKSGIRFGKTTWLSCLQRVMRCYVVGYERDNFDDYRDDKYDIIVMDEFKNQKKLEFLNSLIDGQHKRLDQKFSGTIKKVNLPVIFLSNFHPVEAFSKASSITLDAFIDRLLIVELCTPLFPFIDLINQHLEPVAVTGETV